jgi:hypothetical protein
MSIPIALIILDCYFFLKWRDDVAHGVEKSRSMSLSAAMAGVGLITLLCAIFGYL